MNIQQTLHKETLKDSDGSTTFYVYMDGDGTRHHFQQTSGEWQDQSGLGMKLSFTDSTAVIVDRDHNSMTFDLPTEEFAGNYENVGMLKTIADSCGNTMRITASGCIVSNVQDGIGRNTVFANENNRVSTIYTPGYGEQGTCGFGYDAANHLTHNIRVAFLKAGTSSTRVNTSSIEWSEEWTDWQFAAGPVVAPCDYTSIRFNVDYERNINYAEFGGLFLHKEEFGQTYVYDSRGNVLSAKNAASLQDGATYDAFDNILTYFQPGRSAAVKTVMEWGESDDEKKKHLLRKSTSPLGTVSEYTYDDYGNQLTTKTSDGMAFMQTTTVYDEQGNHVKQQIDARGMAETRQTDDELDTLQSVTDARGQVLHYTYDRNRRVTKASTTADGCEYTNTFAYTKDKLTQVKHNTSDNASEDVAYTLAYDAVGRLESVKVGTQTLVETAYQADGMTESVTYGNRGQVCYTYDDFKRIVGMRYDDDTDDRFQYTYGANGEVARVKDCARDVSVLSEYDAANRPRRKTVLEGDKHAYTGELVYDAYDNVKTFKEQVGENREKYTTTFTVRLVPK